MNLTLTAAQLLRNALPGGVFLLVALLTYQEGKELLTFEGDRGALEATLVIAAAFLVGTGIQSVHRGFAYPYVLRYLIYCNKDFSAWRVPEFEFRHRRFRTELEYRDRHTAQWLREWANTNHFLWGSMWAVLLGLYLPIFGYRGSSGAYFLFSVVAVVLFVSAWADDLRSAYHHEDVYGGRADQTLSRRQKLCGGFCIGVIGLSGAFIGVVVAEPASNPVAYSVKEWVCNGVL